MSDRHAGQVTHPEVSDSGRANLSAGAWQQGAQELTSARHERQNTSSSAEHLGHATVTGDAITFGSHQHGSTEAKPGDKPRDTTAPDSGKPLKPTSETVVVQKGDSYWTLAEDAAGKKSSNQAIADTMGEIQKNNKNKPLHPGDEVRVH